MTGPVITARHGLDVPLQPFKRPAHWPAKGERAPSPFAQQAEQPEQVAEARVAERKRVRQRSERQQANASTPTAALVRDLEADLRRRFDRGDTMPEIAAALNVTVRQLRTMRDLLGLKRADPSQPTLDPAEVRRLSAEGLTTRQIADRLGVDWTTPRRHLPRCERCRHRHVAACPEIGQGRRPCGCAALVELCPDCSSPHEVAACTRAGATACSCCAALEAAGR